MKIKLVLTERKYHGEEVNGKDYGSFSCGKVPFDPELSEERVERILHYLDSNKYRFTGLKIGNHYYKKSFVRLLPESDSIIVFLTVFDSKEVENHLTAFLGMEDITILMD